jgi:hypothetical protein
LSDPESVETSGAAIVACSYESCVQEIQSPIQTPSILTHTRDNTTIRTGGMHDEENSFKKLGNTSKANLTADLCEISCDNVNKTEVT